MIEDSEDVVYKNGGRAEECAGAICLCSNHCSLIPCDSMWWIVLQYSLWTPLVTSLWNASIIIQSCQVASLHKTSCMVMFRYSARHVQTSSSRVGCSWIEVLVFLIVCLIFTWNCGKKFGYMARFMYFARHIQTSGSTLGCGWVRILAHFWYWVS